MMLTIFVAALGFLMGGLAGAAWGIVLLYTAFFLIVMFGG